jgi:chemotaxis protein CheX
MSVETVPTVADLVAICEQVWESYLEPDGRNPFQPCGPMAGTNEMFAAVSITGNWHGHVAVTCSARAARYAAAAFLLMDPDEVGSDDVVDVLGELANIIGGNVKSMLPAGCFVSLPHVVMNGGATRFPSAVQVCELAGTWRGEPMSISLWQISGDRAEAWAA